MDISLVGSQNFLLPSTSEGSGVLAKESGEENLKLFVEEYITGIFSNG